jgi:uncharacterized coiled-coil protein SlyX
MTSFEKTFYALILALATSFGSLVYYAAITRVAALEAQAQDTAQETKTRTVSDQVALTELRTDIKYMRQALDRIEQKLEQQNPLTFRPPQNPPQNTSQNPARSTHSTQGAIQAP